MSQDRVRKVELSNLSPAEADRLSTEIGEKIKEITEKAISDANKLLNIYGMEAKMQVVINELAKVDSENNPVKSTKIEPKPAKNGRKPKAKKAANL